MKKNKIRASVIAAISTIAIAAFDWFVFKSDPVKTALPLATVALYFSLRNDLLSED